SFPYTISFLISENTINPYNTIVTELIRIITINVMDGSPSEIVMLVSPVTPVNPFPIKKETIKECPTVTAQNWINGFASESHSTVLKDTSILIAFTNIVNTDSTNTRIKKINFITGIRYTDRISPTTNRIP